MQSAQTTPAVFARRSRMKFAASILLLLTASCARNGSADSFCVAARPILVADEDVLTDQTARDILAHNKTVERLCRV